MTQGTSFGVTSRGTPVATLSPIEARPSDELTLREGTGEMDFPPGVHIAESIEDALAALRGAR